MKFKILLILLMLFGCANKYEIYMGIENPTVYLENSYGWDSCWVEKALKDSMIEVRCK